MPELDFMFSNTIVGASGVEILEILSQDLQGRRG